MKQVLLKNKIAFLAFLLITFSVFAFVFSTPVSMTKAEENTNSFQPTTQEVIDNTWFIGFSKCENDTLGKSLFANYFINDGYFSPDTHTYGAILFPQVYYEYFIHDDDYVREFTEQGRQYLNVMGDAHYEVGGGMLVRYGLTRIKDQNVGLQYYFVFYAQDKITGEYSYAPKKLASFSTLTQDGEVDLSLYRTNEEFSAMQIELELEIWEMNETILSYENEIEELYEVIESQNDEIAELNEIIESIEAIDLTQYVPKETYDRKVLELETKIDALQSEKRVIGAVERKTGLTFLQVLGIVAGVVVLLLILCGILSSVHHKKKHKKGGTL